MKTSRSNREILLGNTLAARRQTCESPAMKPARLIVLTAVAALLLGAVTACAQTSSSDNPAPAASSKPKTSSKPSGKPSGRGAPAPISEAAPTGTFDDFKAIPDRNIFNTRRYAVRQNDAPPPPPRRERVVESFSLLGTLDYEKGGVAFFEGSSASMKKSAKVDDTIGGCKITAIEPSRVMLEAGGKPVELLVGYMMRREDEGEWKTREAERPVDFSFGSSSSSSFGSSSSSPFGSGGNFSSGRDSRFGSSSSSRDSRFSSGSSRDSRFNSSSSSSSSNRDSRSNSPFGGSGNNPVEMAQQRIRDQDRNGDGKISREEADSRLRPNFDIIDRNRDGFVDAEEYTAYYIQRFGGGSSSSSSSQFNPGSSFNPGGTFNPGSGFNPGSSGSPTTSGSSGNSPGSPPSSGGGESDLLRRLMEQRARENR
jgi:hypothetical protein